MTNVDPTRLKHPAYIRNTAGLRQLVDRLKAESLLAVDTESNSLFAYQEQVCLIQLSTRREDMIIDPLVVDDMSSLGELLADPAIEIVFHAAEYDVITLKRDFGFSFANLFDTMLAARICGWGKTGLGSLLGEQFGVTVDKRFQRADWSQRPLPPDHLRYAQMDTHYLPALRDVLHAELAAQQRLDEAHEIFAGLCELPPTRHEFDPEGYWRIHQLRDLRRSQVAIARELYLTRDEIARRRNWPVFKVFTDETLVEIARRAPRHIDDLRTIAGVGGWLTEREGGTLLHAVEQGRLAPVPRPPHPKIPDPAVQARYDALHEWRKQRALERGVESDVIVPRDALWALARLVPTRPEDLDRIPGLGPWRRAEYGSELLQVLARVGENNSNQN